MLVKLMKAIWLHIMLYIYNRLELPVIQFLDKFYADTYSLSPILTYFTGNWTEKSLIRLSEINPSG